MAPPQISVIVPTRNRRQLLSQTLGSVLAQRGVALEIIVVDEATDEPAALDYLERAQSDPRVTLVRHDTPRGVAEAYNSGISRVQTPWTAFCDDDDLWAPDKLARQFAALAADPDAAWSCTGAVDVDSTGRHIVAWQAPPRARDVYRALLTDYVIPAARSTIVVSTDCLRQVGPFQARLAHTDDWDMWLRLAAVAPLATVDAPLAAYRRHSSSMMHTGYRHSGASQLFALEHADARRRVGLDFVEDRDQLKKSAFLSLESGQRRRALVDYVQLSARTRQMKLAAVGISAFLAPRRTLAHHRARLLRQAPPHYLAEAQSWLAELRPAEWSGTGAPAA